MQHTLNNLVRYMDPTGHFSQDELAIYFGYTDFGALEQSDFWKGLSASLRDVLLRDDVGFGDVLAVGTDTDDTRFAMLIQTGETQGQYGPSGRLAFWDLQRGGLVSLEAINTAPNAVLWDTDWNTPSADYKTNPSLTIAGTPNALKPLPSSPNRGLQIAGQGSYGVFSQPRMSAGLMARWVVMPFLAPASVVAALGCRAGHPMGCLLAGAGAVLDVHELWSLPAFDSEVPTLQVDMREPFPGFSGPLDVFGNR